ncbi:MAG: carbon dioxide concentrating mechanism protein, partial [Alkalinema sp. RU_4_3]|nr:carbon dioxide concentrating mechanism protein [Alkalinema sp. RU_4_3]
MPPSPLQLNPITTDQSFTTGNVVVAAGAAIAPGVLLQADGGCRILVGQGVCLGLGCVVHASGGDIRIGDGANLGAGVLVVGSCEIGDRAIVGSGTTILSQSVPADALLPNSTLWVKPNVAATTPPAVPQPQAKPQAKPQ